jgi:hypothetical protein
LRRRSIAGREPGQLRSDRHDLAPQLRHGIERLRPWATAPSSGAAPRLDGQLPRLPLQGTHQILEGALAGGAQAARKSFVVTTLSNSGD